MLVYPPAFDGAHQPTLEGWHAELALIHSTYPGERFEPAISRSQKKSGTLQHLIYATVALNSSMYTIGLLSLHDAFSLSISQHLSLAITVIL